MTKNRTPTPVYLDPGMHPGLEVKGLSRLFLHVLFKIFYTSIFHTFSQYAPLRIHEIAVLGMIVVCIR